MRWLRGHLWIPVLGAGVATAVVSIPLGGFGPLDLVPFVALALATRWLSTWAGIGAALAYAALLLEAAREAASSLDSSPTGTIIGLALLPLLLAFTVPLVVAVSEAVRVALAWHGGVEIARPGLRDAVITLLLGLAGLVVLVFPGMVVGLALGVLLWARRSAPVRS